MYYNECKIMKNKTLVIKEICSLLLLCMDRWKIPSYNVFFYYFAFIIQFKYLFCSFIRPRSDGWPHHGHRPTFSIYLCPLWFWL